VYVSAGEQTSATPEKIESARPASSLAAVTGWRQGLLVFDSAPLSEVIDEFNRHNLKPMVLQDESLKTLRISGVFPAAGTERIALFLQDRFAVSIRNTDDAIYLTRP
jgi:transmembrane sensor